MYAEAEEPKCPSCKKPPGNMRRCSGCKKVSYCGAACQQSHWFLHIFDCQPGKPISTVYYLARAIHHGTVPVDAQTRMDYGIEKAQQLVDGSAGRMLCGLYKGLIHHHQVPLKTLRQWQKDKRLVEEIKAIYEPLTLKNRGVYYPWFLRHQHVLNGRSLDEHTADRLADETIHNSWRATWRVIYGAGSEPSLDDIIAQRARYSFEQFACFDLYALLLSKFVPPPSTPLWKLFGFVAALDTGDETEIGRKYERLMYHQCPFDEFSAACASRTIPALFVRHGVTWAPQDAALKARFDDAMSGDLRATKSVWDLKHYVDRLVCAYPDEAPPPLPPSVWRAYGFTNCRNASEQELLKKLYMQLFQNQRTDPLALHEACMKSELFEFAQTHGVTLAPKYRRLLEKSGL
ncbi:hypothetical protein C8Q80DRAFT_302116 [Daedaleopsis nitida]|nr:hypothetical protein C8Q80DRAFT_302116 [Daedaleopsis nitida]